MKNLFELTGKTAVVTGANTGLGRRSASPWQEPAPASSPSGDRAWMNRAPLSGGRDHQISGHASRPVEPRSGRAHAAATTEGGRASGYPGQQCRDHPARRRNRFHRAGLGRRDECQPQVRFLPFAGSRAAHAERRERRQDHQHCLPSVVPGRHPHSVLHGEQERAGRPHPVARVEWGDQGINVNAIAPGYFVTNKTEALRAGRKRSTDILGRIPAGRWGIRRILAVPRCSWRREPRITSTASSCRSMAAGLHDDFQWIEEGTPWRVRATCSR